MITDYKGVDLSLKKKKVKTFRIFLVLIVLFAIYLFFSNNADKKKIREIQNNFKDNQIKKAELSFKKIEKSFYHKNSKKIINDVLLLNSGNYDTKTVFKDIDNNSSLIDHNIFLKYFIENLKYKEAEIYLNFAGNSFKEYYYFRAVLATILFKPNESKKAILKINKKNKNLLKRIRILKKLNKEILEKKLYYVFDINGLPIAYYDFRVNKTITIKDFKGFNLNELSPSLKNGLRFYTLTINKDIQKIIHKIFNKYKFDGSFILFSTVDNSILAAYSRNDNNENSVFNKHYEPGSIVKLLTLYAYFKNNIKGIFPYICKSLNINSTPFYDWVSHGKVESYEQALAWSCNIGFAKMGISLGVNKLYDTYTKFLFNRKNIKDFIFKFDTGNFKADNITNDYQLAKSSVGLSVFNKDNRDNNRELISITTVHAALISSAIANKGVIYSPFLIRNIKSISTVGFYNHRNIELASINNPLIFNKIRDAMIKVVTDKSGTGKNSFVPFVKVALKTGTAGKHKPYNAVLTGFFPANRVRYAFAFTLKGSGPSKDKGARFLRDFLKALHKKGDI